MSINLLTELIKIMSYTSSRYVIDANVRHALLRKRFVGTPTKEFLGANHPLTCPKNERHFQDPYK